MQGIMGVFLDGMQNVAVLLVHPINSFTHGSGRRQFIILNIVFGFVFLFLVVLRSQILALLLLLILCFVLSVECLLNPRPPLFRAMIPSLSGWFAYFSSSRPYFSVSASLSRRNCS